MSARPSNRLRLAFYGDDFTGSTDALEVLAFAGLKCALFLSPPTQAMLLELGPFDAIGVAGDSRAMSPGEMNERLPAVLSALAQLNAPLVHYKVCSTFDSAATIGSIGCVMELSRKHFDGVIPIVAGNPALGRYCVFGNLFARSGTDGRVYRIDRHPIMSVHPVTPMTEADLARHIGAQTSMPIANFALPHFMDRSTIGVELTRLMTLAPGAVLFDSTSPEHLTEVGRLLEALANDHGASLFCVGSSGLQYALTQWWRENGSMPSTVTSTTFERFDPVPQVLAISGSASALSAVQIDAAIAAGFVDVPIAAQSLIADVGWESVLHRLTEEVIAALRSGRSVMMHTARGPRDSRIEDMILALVASGQSREQAKHVGGRLLGQRLGELIDRVVRAVPVQRLLVSGGDTSSQIMQRLAPDALVIAARLAPGAPLCRMLSNQKHLNRMEVALKGGQMGQADYFVRAQRGLAAMAGKL